ncbi:hypothetical protein KR093_002992, partial [Drosophila rubida]
SKDEDKPSGDGANKRRKSDDIETPTFNNNTVVVKTEKLEPEDECVSTEVGASSSSIPVVIKSEPVEEIEVSAAAPEPSTSSNDPPAIPTTVVVKTEPPATTKQSPEADSSVSSSTLRRSCRFGIRCYRQNPAHRSAEAHPGDADYRRPSFPAPPLGTPACPFGNECYRRNPTHFQQFSHPSDFNSAQNIRNRLRQRRNQTQNGGGTAVFSDSETDDEDPFHDDADSDVDYQPGANIDDDDDDPEEDNLEFNSERQNCDEFD